MSTLNDSRNETLGDALPERLLQLTIQLREHYETLDQIIESLDKESLRTVDPIAEQMKLVKQTESDLAPLRSQYLAAFGAPTGPLKAETDRTIEIVKTLMPKLSNLEKASMESMKKLFPKIHGSVRAVQMQSAYRGNQVPG